MKRVKRFSIEFERNGQNFWAHANNTGSMQGLLRPGCEALFSPAQAPGRKLPYTLERMRLPNEKGGHWVGVNTLLPNKMLQAAFLAGRLDFCVGYTEIRREAKRGGSRLDACLTGPGLPPLWVECKSVTLALAGMAAFPDAISARGQKHLIELMDIARMGERAAMFYCVQRPDCASFGAAAAIDPDYARLLWDAQSAGVEIYAYTAQMEQAGADLGKRLPVIFT